MIDISKIGVLFDLDGVLLDTETIYGEFWSGIDSRFPTGVSHFSDVIKGKNLKEILEGYFRPENRAEITRILQDFQPVMPYRYFPHAMEWVRQLREAAIPMCIVTSSDRFKMEAVYKQHPEFKAHFEHVIVGEMVERAKPDPECFLLGAQLLNKDIRDCYVFEDSLNGIAAGHASGAKVIGLATTNPREMITENSHLVIDSFEGFSIEKMLSI